MNVWADADDPWANHVKSPGKHEEAPHSLANVGPNGFEDDAIWGDFEISDVDPWAFESSPATNQEAAADYDKIIGHRPRSPALYDSETLKHGDNVGKQEYVQPHLPGRVDPENPAKKDDVQASLEAFPAQSESTDVTEGHPTSPARNALISEASIQKRIGKSEDEDPVSRPISSSSDATDTTYAKSTLSTSTSLNQGLPDAHQASDIDTAEEVAQEARLKHDQQEHENNTVEEEPHSTIATVSDTKGRPIAGPRFDVDISLLDQLIGPIPKRQEVDHELEDLIERISERKMWYRLSRPQTLRGFLSGSTEDNYVRVMWKGSQIRQDTIKIVSKWSSEDRAQGRTVLGGAQKANFSWTEPQSTGSALVGKRRGVDSFQPIHAIPDLSSARRPSATHHLSPMAASPLASFSWSTSPLSPQFSIEAKGSVSASPTSAGVESPWHHSTPSRPSSSQVSAADVDPSFVAGQSESQNMGVEPIASTGASAIAAQKGLTVNTVLAATVELSAAREEEESEEAAVEDDEWGEMVQSPALNALPAVATPESVAPTIGMADIGDEAGDLQNQQSRDRPLTPPVAFKPVIPSGPLSPARRAAFNAARVTRTLSSQHPGHEVPSREVLAPVEDFTKVKLRKTRPPSITEQTAVRESAELLASTSEDAADEADVHIRSRTSTLESGLLPSSDLEDVGLNTDDLSLFDSLYGLGPAKPASSAASIIDQKNKYSPQLTPIGSQSVERFLAQLPDMSYMFKK